MPGGGSRRTRVVHDYAQGIRKLLNHRSGGIEPEEGVDTSSLPQLSDIIWVDGVTIGVVVVRCSEEVTLPAPPANVLLAYFPPVGKHPPRVWEASSARTLSSLLFNTMEPDRSRFMCQYCDRSFKAQSKLEDHERTHTDEKPFVCNYCDAAFSCKGNLDRHRLTHEKNRAKLSCDRCGQSFTCKAHLLRHQRRTDCTNLTCDICGKKTMSSYHLAKHLKTHGIVQPAKKHTSNKNPKTRLSKKHKAEESSSESDDSEGDLAETIEWAKKMKATSPTTSKKQEIPSESVRPVLTPQQPVPPASDQEEETELDDPSAAESSPRLPPQLPPQLRRWNAARNKATSKNKRKDSDEDDADWEWPGLDITKPKTAKTQSKTIKQNPSKRQKVDMDASECPADYVRSSDGSKIEDESLDTTDDDSVVEITSPSSRTKREAVYFCNICMEPYVGYMKMREHGETCFLKCPHCPRQFTSWQSMQARKGLDAAQQLQNHIDRHHTVLHCPHRDDETPCSSKFTSVKRLREHIEAAHTGREGYPCCFCDKLFTTAQGLSRHKRTQHIGEKSPVVEKKPRRKLGALLKRLTGVASHSLQDVDTAVSNGIQRDFCGKPENTETPETACEKKPARKRSHSDATENNEAVEQPQHKKRSTVVVDPTEDAPIATELPWLEQWWLNPPTLDDISNSTTPTKAEEAKTGTTTDE
eukprot:TRINITY_DN68668_c0_g1_i1.p1 TRINITY_DN68668_c0_g1~~TRINITY_DN68668_c0_g1_i1.p1  ORF type:complete len:696 (+),score=48.02 TRINITY_DN68668_c0_g1_i1:58-2145(+)